MYHITGGSAGRNLRKQTGPHSISNTNGIAASGTAGNVFGMPSDLTNKEEVFQFLNSKMSNLEQTASNMMNEIAEIKMFMNTLQNTSGYSGKSNGVGIADAEN